MSEKKSAPHKATVAKSARVKRVAAKIAAGKSINQIAAEEKLHRSTVSEYVNAGEVRQIIGALVDAEFPLVQVLFRRSLRGIEEALEADALAIEKVKDRATGTLKIQVRTLGPDHYARLTAVRRLLDVMLAGRPLPKPAEQTKEVGATADELRALLEAEGLFQTP